MNIKIFTRAIASILFRFFWIFPVKKNKIIFCSYSGKGISDNPKYIMEEIIKQDLEYDLVWIAKQNINYDNISNKVRYVKWKSIRSIYELATAKVWIDNSRKLKYIRKRKAQYYIQTWHGAIALKQIEKDAEDVLDKYYVESAKNDSRMADLLISNSKFCTNLYRNSFWYDGSILECGSPRNDILINDTEYFKLKICEYYKLDKNINIAMYAPTFRRNNNLDVYNLDYEKCISALKNKFGGEWVIIVRLHPSISEKAKNIKYTNNIINGSIYDDMQQLLAATDILITDYSSSMFDFMITKKPIILYATDMEEYKKDRNFYFNIEELPFKVASNNQEMENGICEFDNKVYINKLNQFISRLDINENGVASYKVVEVIKNFINNNTREIVDEKYSLIKGR